VLALLREGLSNEQIAERLGVTLHAARYHVSEILSKLGVATREEAAAWQPKEARLGPRWSIAFQIWLAAAASVALIAVGVLAWGVFRGSSDDSQASVVATGSPAPGASTPAVSFVPASPPPAVGPNVRAMQLVSETVGWALTDDALLRITLESEDCLKNACKDIIIEGPKDITPHGVAIAGIKGVHFLDSDHGWLVANGAFDASALTQQLLVFRTTDGGQSWQSSPLGPSDAINAASAFAPAYIDFLNASTGWVVAKTGSNTSFSIGDLYRTDDGGATWTKLSIPTGDPVYFTNENDGWAAGGPIPHLFVTHDGGRTWQDASDIAPVFVPSVTRTRAFGLPTAVDGDSRLLLPVTVALPDNPSLFIIYDSVDGGNTWNQLASATIASDFGAGIRAPSHVFADGSVVAFAPDRTGLRYTPGDSQMQTFTSTIRAWPIQLDVVDSNRGWALVIDSGCETFKSHCRSLNYVEQTEDGGLTWTPVVMPGDNVTPGP
jgi:hypothetical protein